MTMGKKRNRARARRRLTGNEVPLYTRPDGSKHKIAKSASVRVEDGRVHVSLDHPDMEVVMALLQLAQEQQKR